MTENPPPEDNNAPFGLTEAEFEDVKSLLRYAVTIFAAVGVALIVVAFISSLF
jgi:hypothetical protein